MALLTKTKKILDQAIGGKKAGDSLAAAMVADATLDRRQLRELQIMLGDKKAAANIAAAIDASTGTVDDRSNRALKNAMITRAAAADMKSNIQG